MKERTLGVTMRDIQRYKVLSDLLEKKLTGVQAAQLLGLSSVHVSRLKQKLCQGGFEALLRKPPPQPPHVRITASMIATIIKLRRSLYYDFNIMHFKDKLAEVHRIRLSYESLRRILIQADEHHPRRKRKVHRQRRRMPKAGLLEQMDSSQHHWLAHIPEQWWLIAIIDDATNEIPYAWFFPKDTLFANMHVLRRFIEIKGLFVSLYVDKASHFKTTRQGGLHYTVNPEQEETQIERALDELDITIIPANSPQAKGRIEVTFRLFQDRLIKEMRLAGVKDYAEANRFLVKKFLPWYNGRFVRTGVESAFMPLPKDKNLDLIFCIKKERIVNMDNTVQFAGQVIQISPSPLRSTFAKAKVTVCLREDKRIFVLYKGVVIARSVLSPAISKHEARVERILNKRTYLLTDSLPREYPESKIP
jgi:hypothetical protein